MKTLAFLLVAALAVPGCSKKSSGGACEAAINGAVDRMTQSRGSAMPPQMKEMVDKLKAVVLKRCTEDHWSDEVIDCYGKAGNMADIRTCRNKLPQDLGQKLLADEMQVMGGAMGGNGQPMPIPMRGTAPPATPEPGPATPAPAPAAGSGSGG